MNHEPNEDHDNIIIHTTKSLSNTNNTIISAAGLLIPIIHHEKNRNFIPPLFVDSSLFTVAESWSNYTY